LYFPPVSDIIVTMVTVTLDLPDTLVSKARKKGLLSPRALEKYIRVSLNETAPDVSYPPDFDPRLKGLVSPALYRKGTINGDIIGPFHDEWENGY
jgi:hypothetical protein